MDHLRHVPEYNKQLRLASHLLSMHETKLLLCPPTFGLIRLAELGVAKGYVSPGELKLGVHQPILRLDI